uniref:NACHT domain-containing protein n=1 Tax=Pygocentrus nattereri TaxID=42514 RepID=A0A3B4CEY7_PYGNA
MKMEEVDLEEDVMNVVAEEATVIVDVLCRERSNVLEQIYGLVERSTRDWLQSLPSLRERVLGIVDYFRASDPQKCCQFLQTMWMFCQSIPLDLETKVLSIAGSSSGVQGCFPENENSPRSCNVKRLCLDQVESYTNAVKLLLQQKFERVTKDVVKEVCLDEAWLCLRQRHSARVRDKSAQAQEGEEPSEHKESVESLLRTTGRVVVLLGQAGSGKTLLMHCLAHHWAQGFYPSIKLLFLLEFRQLNLVSQPLSLKELLFSFFLLPEGGVEQSEAVFSYILSNPEKICFIFDGYDEFGTKFTDPEKLPSPLGPYQQLSVTDLLSGICSYKILPKCTVLVTCRPRDVIDLFGSSGYFVAELLGFSQRRVKEYTETYFQEKGSELKERAVNLLMGNRHLLSMSHVPALCHVCCICLDHFLSEDTSQSHVKLPTSLTQIYLHILSAFLSRCQGGGSTNVSMPLLQKYRSQIAELSRLAMHGLENSRIVFLAQDLSTELMNFGANAGILSRVDLTCADGSHLGCAFMHLTMQEFLSALHLMTSPGISESQLKRKLNLKSRWTARTDPKTVFTDSLHLFMCGLAAKACRPSLALLEGSDDATAVVKKRQETVLKILRSFVGTASQTGPKIIELCRCAHETQDVSLAKDVASRTTFELRNIRLSPVDMDALAFVTSAADQMVCLDFGGCSIELECLSIIPNCKNLEHLIFRSRKYDDKFAEALSSILPDLQDLKQLHFISGGLTDTGTEKLIKALECCPQITHLNVSDNSLSDEVMYFSSLLCFVLNQTKALHNTNELLFNALLSLLLLLVVVAVVVVPIVVVKIVEVVVFFNYFVFRVFFSLTHSDIHPTDMNRLCKNLAKCKHLLELDFSHGTLKDESVERLQMLLPGMTSLQLLNLSYVQMSTDGALLLVRSLADCPRITTMELRQQGESFVRFRQITAGAATCKLIQYKLNGDNVKDLSGILEHCSYLADLDLSSNFLRDEDVKSFVNLLPRLQISNSLSLSNNKLTQLGALYLVNSLNSCEKVAAFIFICNLTLKIQKDMMSSLIIIFCVNNGWSYCFSVRIEEPWIKAEAAVRLVSSCLDLNSHIREIRVEKTCFEISLEGLPSRILYFVNDCIEVFSALYCDFSFFSFGDCEVEGQHLTFLQSTLQKCSSLLKLHFSQTTLGTNGAEFFSSVLPCLKKLKTLSLHSKGEGLDEAVIFALQSSQKHLENLSLSHHVINDSEAAKLGSALQGWTQMRSLNLSHCTGWTAAGGYKLVCGLVHCITLEEMRLNKIQVEVVEGSGVLCLLACLQSLDGLEELELEGLRMGDQGIKELVKYIPKWTTLRKINLSENCVSDQAGEMLVKALSHCRALQQLHLFRNKLGHEFAVRLGQVLPSLPQLSELECLFCSLTAIGTSDLICIASCLKHCTSIESISLAWNECGNDVAEKLAEVLPQCSTLKKIDLEANNINITGAKALVKCLQCCPWIEVIRLWRNPIVKDDQILRDQRLNFSPT